MGAFFTSVHVLAPAQGDSLAAARAVLEEDARAHGLRPTLPGEVPDRRVVLRPEGRWLSVYDSAGEGPDERALGRVVAALSTALDTSVFWVLVHDSRVLRLGLYVKGQYRDLYDSNPAYFQEEGAERGSPEAHLGAWRHLLAPGQAEARLAGVFAHAGRFAEDALPALAETLGVAAGRLSTGPRYLLAEGIPHDATTLAWCGTARKTGVAGSVPSLETPGQQVARIYGATVPAGPAVEAAAGGPVRLGATALNRGGPGTGLVVEVRGGAPVVRWGRVRLLLGDPRAGAAIDALLVEDGDHQVARFPSAAIPPGLAATRLPPGPAEALAAVEARLATAVHANVLGTARAPGRVTVQVRLAPAQGVGATVSAEVVVTEAEARPAASAETTLRREEVVLAQRSCLAALVVLEPERAAECAVEVVARLRGAVPTGGEVRTTRYPAPGRGHPAVDAAGAAGFLQGPAWQDLVDAASAGFAKVDAEWFEDRTAFEASVRLAFGIGIAPPEDPLPVLSIALRRGDLDGAEQAIGEALDGLARGAGLVQAFTTRWGEMLDLEVTPWETAAGVHGQCTLGRAWATRWVRGIGPGRLWLGPDLLARLDLDAVTAALATTRLGPSLRIDVERVDGAVRALGTVVPVAADWRRVVTAGR